MAEDHFNDFLSVLGCDEVDFETLDLLKEQLDNE